MRHAPAQADPFCLFLCPIKGASEIDRQIGTVDEDLLVDDEEPEPVDFPLPSQVSHFCLPPPQPAVCSLSTHSVHRAPVLGS